MAKTCTVAQFCYKLAFKLGPSYLAQHRGRTAAMFDPWTARVKDRCTQKQIRAIIQSRLADYHTVVMSQSISNEVHTSAGRCHIDGSCKIHHSASGLEFMFSSDIPRPRTYTNTHQLEWIVHV